jgi:hypothetical protein
MRVWLLLFGMWFLGAATLSYLSPGTKVIFVCLGVGSLLWMQKIKKDEAG